MPKDEALEFISEAKNSDGRDVEDRELLSRNVDILGSQLWRRFSQAIELREREVSEALGRALVTKFHARQVGTQSCVIYCRVSSEVQMKGMGLWRQLKTCAEYASLKDFSIIGIFSEVASGVGPLPVRDMAVRMAQAHNALLLCEDASRWSRKGKSDAAPAYVLMTSEVSQEFEKEFNELMEEFNGPNSLVRFDEDVLRDMLV